MPRIRRRTDRRFAVALVVFGMMALVLTLAACAPDEPKPTETKALPADTIDPEEWGKVYPRQLADWQATAEARPTASKYKKGGEGDPDKIQYDKLSEYPFLAALAKGIGFSVEFNEPRGHALALKDQNAIDPARLKAGGVCLACKTPYYDKLKAEQGDTLYSMPYEQAMQLIPEEHRELGVSCANCHKAEDTTLKVSPLMEDALGRIKAGDMSENQQRNAVCGQCHSTYTIPKADGKSVGLFMPWNGGAFGDVSVENMIQTIEGDPANYEWTHAITGLKLGYIRHPEYELYTRGSIHFVNDVTCVDCHMPYKIEDSTKVSDHDVMSPMDNNLRACRPCHPGRTEEQLKESVWHIQDQFIGGLLNAGYSVIGDAQLMKMVLESKIDTTTGQGKADWDAAEEAYRQAFYRVAYASAENSVGFHNPPEAFRIVADAQAYSERCEGILRSMLVKEGIEVPNEIVLNLLTYIENRGEANLQFDPKQEFKDPRGTAEILWRENLKALRTGTPMTTPTAQ